MRVCDVCGKKIDFNDDKVFIYKGIQTFNYEICGKCAKKIIRCIKYMKMMNQKGGVK